MLIRKIIPDDNAALAIIIRTSLKEFNANKPGTVYFDETTDHLSDVFKTKRSAYYVIEKDGKIAGGGGFYPTEGLPSNTCELVKMYLAKEYRGKGWEIFFCKNVWTKQRNRVIKKCILSQCRNW
jgi:putative acetyltransferase